MRYLLSVIAGVVTSFDFPVYDYGTGVFSIMNTLLLAVICVSINLIATWMSGNH